MRRNREDLHARRVQAKLDELIRALDHGRNEFIGIEHLSEKELIAIRDKLERECGREMPERHEGVGRLLRRHGRAP